MKHIVPLLLLLLTSIFGFSQHKNIDSLITVTQSNTTDKEKAWAFQRLAWLHLSKDTKKATHFLDSSATIYRELKDKEGLIQIVYKRSVINRLSGNYPEALEQINTFISHKESLGDSLSVADALFQKGVIIGLMGDFSEGLKTYYRALAIYERNDEPHSIANVHNSIGIVFKNFGQWDEAIKNYKKAEAIQVKIAANVDLANTYNSMGTVHALKKDFDTALQYFNKSLALDTELNSAYGIALNNQDIGIMLFEQKKFDQAIPYLQTAYKIQKKNNYEAEFLQTLTTLSLLHGEQGNSNLSKTYIEEAEQLDTNFNLGEQSFHKAYQKYYESQKNFKESLHHFKQYSTLKDSIFNTENQQVINGLRLQYETEKKDKEIAQQQLTLEKSLAKTQTMTVLIISLLIASILLWSFFRQRQKRIQQQLATIQKEQEVRTLESLIAGEEKERLRIAQELHDGVNGDLSAIKFKLTSLLKMNNDVINEAVSMIDNSCKQVRAISHNLVPPSLKDFNLIEAISNYCENKNDIHKPNIHFQHIGTMITLNKKIEVNIFRIVQELVTNAIKHAEANTINVQTSFQNNTIQLTVEDDGKGLDDVTISNAGIGLENVKSRIEYLNATLDVLSNEKGTSYTIDIDTHKLDDN